jgi:hypothetical protein
MAEGRDSTVDALEAFRFEDAAGESSTAGRKKNADAAPSGGSKRAANPRRASLEARLSEGFGSIGVLVSMFDPVCGTTLVENAPKLAEAWDEAAKNNPQVRKVLEGLMTGGTMGGAIFVTAMTLLPILQHHGMLPFGFGRVPTDEIPIEENADNGQSVPTVG